ALDMMRAALATCPYEIVLSDVQMPGVDGIDLARRIKADPAFAAPAVILVSSVGTAKDFAQRLQGLDVDAWLTKPIPQSALYNALLNALVHKQQLRPEEQPAAAAAHSALAEPSSRAKLPAGRKLRVLLAEDNPINQKLAKFQLKKMGVKVDCVSNGREAVAAATRIPYDAVLMDCQMPEMDGYEATREIRRREGTERHTRIIALTAHALTGDRETCLDAGMDAYVSKPVKPEILEGILAEVVAPDTAAADAPAVAADAPSSDPPPAALTGAVPPV
ncbi:MAG TPA: response regulator, partial [Candidatus Binataceae bacterium]